MPQIGRVEISIIEEDQARWLAFQNGELDLMNMEGPLAPQGARRRPAAARARGQGRARCRASSIPEITYTYWNMQDPVVGGFAKEKIALRRAMAMAYNVDEEIRVIRNGQAVEAQYPIPPGVVGHDPDWQSSIALRSRRAPTRCSTASATSSGADGWRTLPDGKPLVVRYASRPDSLGRAAGRAVEEVARRDRHPDGGPQGQVPRAAQGREAVQAA